MFSKRPFETGSNSPAVEVEFGHASPGVYVGVLQLRAGGLMIDCMRNSRRAEEGVGRDAKE